MWNSTSGAPSLVSRMQGHSSLSIYFAGEVMLMNSNFIAEHAKPQSADYLPTAIDIIQAKPHFAFNCGTAMCRRQRLFLLLCSIERII